MGICCSCLDGEFEGTLYGKSEDQYKLRSLVERGTFSDVICGQRKSDGRQFALKIQREPLTGSISKELTFLKTFRHPNIIRLEDSFKERACWHLVLDYAGRSLKEIRSFSVLDICELSQVIRGLLSGLAFLKSVRTMHLNVKAEHVMWNNGDLKLIGFGAAKTFPYLSLPIYKPRGTTQWMAPELIRGAQEGTGYGFACDVWSAGITIIEILEGHPPHHQHTEQQLIEHVTSPFYRSPTLSARTFYADVFADFLALALAVQPESRATVERLQREQFFVKTMRVRPTAPQEDDIQD